jgi:hypothetical protein
MASRIPITQRRVDLPLSLSRIFSLPTLIDIFKESVSVIILKLGKPHHDTPKMFRPIILLNTLGKLFEKMLAQHMQYDTVCLGIFHSN